jgi:hypothetical protein
MILAVIEENQRALAGRKWGRNIVGGERYQVSVQTEGIKESDILV